MKARAAGPRPHGPRGEAIAINGALLVASVIALFPLLWMVSVSRMAPGEASSSPPPLLPAEPTLVMVGILTLAGYFQLFAEPYVMTQGGPLRSTTSLVLMMYEEGFRWWRMGAAAAIAFVLFVLILLWTLLQLWVERRTGRTA